MVFIVILVVGFLYIANFNIIMAHVQEYGEFTVNDLVHVFLGPLTLVCVLSIRFVSFFVDLDMPLWKRNP
jgi:hypothetical protein